MAPIACFSCSTRGATSGWLRNVSGVLLASPKMWFGSRFQKDLDDYLWAVGMNADSQAWEMTAVFMAWPRRLFSIAYWCGTIPWEPANFAFGGFFANAQSCFALKDWDQPAIRYRSSPGIGVDRVAADWRSQLSSSWRSELRDLSISVVFFGTVVVGSWKLLVQVV